MPSDNPDFDSMSPEEIMKWMESLAKRQGATEGFTTSADAQVAEIDPSSVVIDEPGYVPSEGVSKRTSTTAPAKPAAAPVPPPAPEPAELPAIVAQVPEPEVSIPPILEQAVAEQADNIETELAPVVDPGALSWLESLAADTSSALPPLDLSNLTADSPAAAQPASDPLSWLEGLSQGEAVQPAPSTAQPAPAEKAQAPVTDPLTSGIDPMTWLESLAKRQGANSEELLTSADVSVPVPENPVIDGPGYVPFSFDTPPAKPEERPTPASSFTPVTPAQQAETTEPLQLEDTNAWLDALAGDEGFGSETVIPPGSMSDEDIRVALETGNNVPPDEMEAFLNRQMDKLFEEPEMPIEEFDLDAPAIRPEIPEWLIEQVGPPPTTDQGQDVPTTSEPAPAFPAFTDDLTPPPPVDSDLPDWLKPVPGETEGYFEIEVMEPSTPPGTLEIDASDPWVEAFETPEKDLEAWYEETISHPERTEAVESVLQGEEVIELEEAFLAPESELPEGQLEDELPDWLRTAAPEATPAEVPDWLRQEVVVETPTLSPTDSLPDWLREAEVGHVERVPDWLLDTVEEEQSEIPQATVLADVPTQILAPVTAPAPAGYSPAPPPPDVSQINVQEVLNSARTKAGNNDVDGSLQDYEMVIRANAQLDAVVGDLRKLVERYSNHPAAYRVLGDGLMRQGKLQEALNIYRKALNQL